MDAMETANIIPALKAIVKQAHEEILSVYRQGEGLEVDFKADDSPLTAADRAANTVICAGLEALPELYPILSEENRSIAFEERKNYPFYWLVDPLDGTKEFIRRNGEFTVNIALIHEGMPVLGIVGVPVSGEIFWAKKGEGAYRCDAYGQDQRIEAAAFRMADPMLRVVASRSHLNEATAAYIGQLQEPQLVSRGSSLKLMALATGEAHLYPRLAPTMEWDTGAAQIILEEAGGQLCRYADDQPLVYNKADLTNPSFIAYARVIA